MISFLLQHLMARTITWNKWYMNASFRDKSVCFQFSNSFQVLHTNTFHVLRSPGKYFAACIFKRCERILCPFTLRIFRGKLAYLFCAIVCNSPIFGLWLTMSTGTTSMWELNMTDDNPDSVPFQVSHTANPGGGWKWTTLNSRPISLACVCIHLMQLSLRPIYYVTDKTFMCS